jgi:hypothetical protein
MGSEHRAPCARAEGHLRHAEVAARCGTERREPFRWAPLDLWKNVGFLRKIVAFGAVTAMLSQCVGSTSAALIDSLSGAYNDATPHTGSNTFETAFSLASGTTVNDTTNQLSSGTYDNLPVDLTGATVSGSNIIGFTLSPMEISFPASSPFSTAATGDTVTFNFAGPVDTPSFIAFGAFDFYLGVIQASISSVTATGNDSAAFLAALSDFNVHGGSLVLTYNGINVTTSGASISSAPSESFSLLANATPSAPEPTTTILSLSGAAAIILVKLARELRKRNSIAIGSSPDS